LSGPLRVLWARAACGVAASNAAILGMAVLGTAASSLGDLDGWTRIIASGPIIGDRGVTTTKPCRASARLHQPFIKKPASDRSGRANDP
jgi:hypothetical protein